MGDRSGAIETERGRPPCACSRRLVEKSSAGSGRGYVAPVARRDEPVTMASDKVVYGITNRPGNDSREERQPPETTHVAGYSQARGRADQHTFVVCTGVFHPDHRVSVRNLWMTRANVAADVALQGGKAQCVLALVPENELHARGAEAAVAVVEQQWCRTRRTLRTQRTRFTV